MNPGIYPQILANYLKAAVGTEIGVDGVSHLRLDTSELSIGNVEARLRTFIGAPQDANREDVLAALISHSAYARRASDKRDA